MSREEPDVPIEFELDNDEEAAVAAAGTSGAADSLGTEGSLFAHGEVPAWGSGAFWGSGYGHGSGPVSSRRDSQSYRSSRGATQQRGYRSKADVDKQTADDRPVFGSGFEVDKNPIVPGLNYKLPIDPSGHRYQLFGQLSDKALTDEEASHLGVKFDPTKGERAVRGRVFMADKDGHRLFAADDVPYVVSVNDKGEAQQVIRWGTDNPSDRNRRAYWDSVAYVLGSAKATSDRTSIEEIKRLGWQSIDDISKLDPRDPELAKKLAAIPGYGDLPAEMRVLSNNPEAWRDLENKRVDIKGAVGPDGNLYDANGHIVRRLPSEGQLEVKQEPGGRIHPVTGQWQKDHDGIDFGHRVENAGRFAVATAYGAKVIQAGGDRSAGYGYSVTLEYPNGETEMFGHLKSIAVQQGQLVDFGQTVGEIGSTGLSTGEHIHWRVRDKDKNLIRDVNIAGIGTPRLGDVYDPATSVAALEKSIAEAKNPKPAAEDPAKVAADNLSKYGVLAAEIDAKQKLADAMAVSGGPDIETQRQQLVAEIESNRKALAPIEASLTGIDQAGKDQAKEKVIQEASAFADAEVTRVRNKIELEADLRRWGKLELQAKAAETIAGRPDATEAAKAEALTLRTEASKAAAQPGVKAASDQVKTASLDEVGRSLAFYWRYNDEKAHKLEEQAFAAKAKAADEHRPLSVEEQGLVDRATKASGNAAMLAQAIEPGQKEFVQKLFQAREALQTATDKQVAEETYQKLAAQIPSNLPNVLTGAAGLGDPSAVNVGAEQRALLYAQQEDETSKQALQTAQNNFAGAQKNLTSLEQSGTTPSPEALEQARAEVEKRTSQLKDVETLAQANSARADLLATSKLIRDLDQYANNQRQTAARDEKDVGLAHSKNLVAGTAPWVPNGDDLVSGAQHALQRKIEIERAEHVKSSEPLGGAKMVPEGLPTVSYINPRAIPDTVKEEWRQAGIINADGWMAYSLGHVADSTQWVGENGLMNVNTGEVKWVPASGGGRGVDETQTNGSTPGITKKFGDHNPTGVNAVWPLHYMGDGDYYGATTGHNFGDHTFSLDTPDTGRFSVFWQHRASLNAGGVTPIDDQLNVIKSLGCIEVPDEMMALMAEAWKQTGATKEQYANKVAMLNMEQVSAWDSAYNLAHPAAEVNAISNLGASGKRVVVIDPGHGGGNDSSHDSGAIGYNGVSEKEANWLLALDIKKKLEAKGYEVVFTKDKMDVEEVTRDNRGAAPMAERRTTVAGAEKADLFLSIHQDDPGNTSMGGMRVFYNPVNRRALDKTASEKLANAIGGKAQADSFNIAVLNSEHHQTVVAAGAGQALPEGTGLAQLAMLIEATNVKNPQDFDNVVDPAKRDQMAERIASGVDKVLKDSELTLARANEPNAKNATEAMLGARKYASAEPGSNPGNFGNFEFVPEVEGYIKEAAEAAGINRQALRKVIKIESDGNIDEGCNAQGYCGLGQLSVTEFHKYYPGQNVLNPRLNVMATAQKLRADALELQAKLGTVPTLDRVYLQHQQGASGSAALVQHPDMPAWEALHKYTAQWSKSAAEAQDVISRNLPKELRNRATTMTSREFADYYAQKSGNDPIFAASPQVAEMVQVKANTAPMAANSPQPAANVAPEAPEEGTTGGRAWIGKVTAEMQTRKLTAQAANATESSPQNNGRGAVYADMVGAPSLATRGVLKAEKADAVVAPAGEANDKNSANEVAARGATAKGNKKEQAPNEPDKVKNPGADQKDASAKPSANKKSAELAGSQPNFA
jgi:N-acetylmuramoyl-L-alanine amidase/murein DD-endopeptidase MepM/ murein hydrolase activator NlpD